MKYALPILLAIVLLSACGPSHPALPSAAATCTEQPRLLPDYTEVTVPVNIAPLNFMVDETEVSQAILRLQAEGFDNTYGGDDNRIIIDEEEWHRLLHAQAGKSLTGTLYTLRGTQWSQHPGFQIHVSPDTIDRYLSYRLIEPSYVGYENIDICQRDLSSFTESTILTNRSKNHKEQCLNCHSYQNFRTDNMLLHIRGAGGGTMLVRNGQPTLRTDLRREGMMSNPVYPAWHPTLPYIAFSTNKTGQFFHLLDPEKIEVQDAGSALVLYDLNNDRMISIPSADEDFETFPAWSPDGKYLYYCSLHYERQDTIDLQRELGDHYRQLHYNLFRRAFDPENLTFSERELVLDLEAMGHSATFPRISPDGRYMLFACGLFGYFHIWHSHADIWKLDLTNGEIDTLNIVNSNRAESYPSWSSTGRWMLFASRRNDGNYSRICMAHVDANGVASKPFELPQRDPFFTRQQIKSYNRPEFMVEPAKPLP